MKTFISWICLLIPVLLSCQPGRSAAGKASSTDQAPLFAPGPRAMIYKTTRDYSDRVPVTMNRERTRIVSYPAPSDLYYKGKLAVPDRLADGYLLDNRGIGANTVFLDYTYDEYTRLKVIPNPDELAGHILDKYPFTVLWDCGTRNRYKDEIKELNRRIAEGFAGCRKIETGGPAGKDPDYGK